MKLSLLFEYSLKDRLEKILRLYHNPGTDGEKIGARAGLLRTLTKAVGKKQTLFGTLLTPEIANQIYRNNSLSNVENTQKAQPPRGQAGPSQRPYGSPDFRGRRPYKSPDYEEEAQQLYCTGCGNKHSPSAIFCTDCGKKR